MLAQTGFRYNDDYQCISDQTSRKFSQALKTELTVVTILQVEDYRRGKSSTIPARLS
jgi:hypothetical protein